MDYPEIDSGAPAGPTANRRSAEHWVLLAFALIAVVGLIALRLLVEPDERGFGTHEQLGFMPCFPLQAWNFPCPGCGVTTSVSYATRGDVIASFLAQPFGLVLALGAPLFAGWAAVAHVRGRDIWYELNRLDWMRTGAIGLTLIAASWIYKIAAVRGLL